VLPHGLPEPLLQVDDERAVAHAAASRRSANQQAQNQAQQFNAQQLEAALARQRAAGEDLVSAASTQNQNQLATAQAQAALGDQLRQIQAAYNLAPISALASETGLLNSLPLNLFHGQVDDSTGHTTETRSSFDPIGAFGTLATGVSSLMGMPFGNMTLGARF
jgi:hypothetical protein